MYRILREKIGKIIDKFLVPLLFRKNDGTYILEEDWDNLIILDDCRYDFFEKIYREMGITKGRLEYRYSRGTTTEEFLIENFGLGMFEDIVYITANPMVDKVLKGKFYKIISAWKEVTYAQEGKGKDFSYHFLRAYTVPPSVVYKLTLKALRKYPDKRLIIHFLQPHCPYPNGTGIYKEVKVFGSKRPMLKYKIDENEYVYWQYYRIKPIKINKLLEGYIENLRHVMPYVKKLIDILPGRTIVTADHGEGLGERIHPLIPVKFYGHHARVRIPALTKVPWLIVEEKDKDKRIKIEEDEVRQIIKDLKRKKKI